MPWRAPVEDLSHKISYARREPYKVWISEVMLQQTQVATVLPYFNRWIKHFPNIYTLSDAKQEEVLKLWEGLGYYSRARNLLLTAKIVSKQYDGVFPKNIDELCQLPGIGHYTASAILSFAYGIAVPVVDANVARVVSRVFLLKAVIGSSKSRIAIEKSLLKQHKTLIAAIEKNCKKKSIDKHSVWEEVALLNEALIEFGALVCTAKNPLCKTCCIREYCKAHAVGSVESLPNRLKKKRPQHVKTWVVVLRQQEKILLSKRTAKSGTRMEGLWQFPSLEHCHIEEDFSWEQIVDKLWGRDSVRIFKNSFTTTKKTIKEMPAFTRIYSGFRVEIRGWAISINLGLARKIFPCKVEDLHYQWIDKKKLTHLPMAKQGDRIRQWIKNNG